MPDEPHVNLRFEDPFLAPVGDRRPDRRLRGRLVAPVTIWTAGSASNRVGLTVSSVLVSEGEPAQLLGLLDPLSDLRSVLEESGVFVVHVLHEGDRRLGESFAGKYPADPFEGLEVSDSAFGPVIHGRRTVVSCRFDGAREAGYQALVSAVIEAIDIGPVESPLAHYRGRFRTLDEA